MDFQRLINEARFVSKTNRLPSSVYEEAMNRHYAYEENLMLEDDAEDSDKEYVLSHIENDDYVVDDYKKFCEELGENKRREFLSPHTPEELKNNGVHTYTVPGYSIGFALTPVNDDIDIIGVHNNTSIRGIGDALIESAKRLGGTTLDHFDGFLSDFYGKHGFKEYDRSEWNDEWGPKNWDKETYGTPDVVFRRYKKDEE